MSSKVRNMNELREIMLETIEKLRDGKIEPTDALAMSKSCDTVIGTIKSQYEYAKLTRSQPEIPFLEDAAIQHRELPFIEGEAEKPKLTFKNVK